MARTKQSARKRKSSDYAADDEFVANDSDGADRPTKRNKPTTSFSPSTRLQPQTDPDGNTFWEISKMRRVTISEYKGKQMVSVREYYEQDGEVKPGKKGISMPSDQFSAFVELLPQIEKALVRRGEKVARPQYNAPVKEEEDVDEADLSDVGDENGGGKKSNIEATSDEDED